MSEHDEGPPPPPEPQRVILVRTEDGEVLWCAAG